MKLSLRKFIPFTVEVSRLLKSIFTKKKKIIIFRPDEFGDVILWLDAAAKLRKHFHAEKYIITLMGKPLLRSFLCQFPYWDRVIDFDPSRYEVSLIYRIRSILKIMGADIIINPIIARPFAIDRLIGHSLATKRFAPAVPWDEIRWIFEENRQYGNTCYTDLIELELKAHVSQINISFVNSICKTNYAAELDPLDFIKTNSKSETPLNYFDSMGQKTQVGCPCYYIVVPGAGAPGRCWETAKFADLINRIHKSSPDLQAVICGTSAESNLADRIISQIPGRNKIINLCGKTNLLELVALVRKSRFVVGNDTGTIHLAACLKILSVCILGGGHYGIFQPYPPELINNVFTEAVYRKMECYDCTWSCYKASTFDKPFPCISAITVDDVWDRVVKVLDDK